MALYRVFKLRFNLAVQDPDLPSPRYHTVIFVETNARGPGTGTKHHVTGDLVQGMHYESVPEDDPDTSPDLFSRELLGHAEVSTYLKSWDKVLEEIPPPPRQKAFNTVTMRTEMVKHWDPLTFYSPGEPRSRPMKCTEWVEMLAIPTLRSQGLLK